MRMMTTKIQIKLGSLKLGISILLALTIILKLVAQQSEAYYPGPKASNQQAITSNPNYYNLQQTNGLHLPSLVDDGTNIGQLMESTKYQLVPDTSGQLSSYLSPAENGVGSENLPTLDQLDIQKLVAYLAQLQEYGNSGDSINDENGAIVASASDLNSHLSPTDPLADTISGPVNDPADFEAVLSQLTNTINHELPNSSNRSAILDSLLSVYLGNIMQQLKQQQQHQANTNINNDANDDSNIIFSISGTNNNDDNDSIATTEAELISLRGASSAAPISRYGNGEYIDHPLALIGHQYVQGGAGEGRQLLGPDGAFENVQVIKSDHAVPSYCDPPNPCPIGYTAEDGCLEKFVNSASFSREYQVKQQCSCDNEHSLFNCASPVSTIKSQIYSIPSSSISSANNQQQVIVEGDGQATSHSMMMNTGSHISGHQALEQQHPISDSGNENNNNNWLETLARTIQNRFGGLASVRNLIGKHEKEALIGQQANDDDNDQQYSNNIVKKGFQIGSNYKY